MAAQDKSKEDLNEANGHKGKGIVFPILCSASEDVWRFVKLYKLQWMNSGFVFDVKVKASPAHSTMALIEEESEETDPWDLPELKDSGIPWSGKDLYLYLCIISANTSASTLLS